jgi:hypothetical protein
MARTATLFLTTGVIGAAFVLGAAQQPSVFAQAQPGLWEISGAPGARAPVRQCVADLAALARFEHRASVCTARIVADSASSAHVEYSCGGAGFGQSQVELLTPRSLRISTQGISGGLPFNYVLQARRVDDCPKSASFSRH